LELVRVKAHAVRNGGLHGEGSLNPALAVPVGKSSAGLPISMQLVGRFFDDPLLRRIAHAYQHATDWSESIRVRA
jgi:Asp-tRNA(Asn)/Glu-tRNA(Gln) amidotransferase A subunit family amidase